MTERDRRAPGPGDRLRAWLVTGPLGRLAGFLLEAGAALALALRRRLGQRPR